jgi:trans-aconitate methyltransferase
VEPLLYRDLVPWYRLIDPTADHHDEALSYRKALEGAVPDAKTLLDLGGGAGNNAFHLKSRFECTLVDLSDDMLGLSRAINPECEHHVGDMRSVRLERMFDVVLVHDAIMYMTTEEELLAAVRTAFVHTRPGGAAVFAPDYTRETFQENTDRLDGDDGKRSMRGLEWVWDPDPNDTQYSVEYAFLLRDGTDVKAVHDRHLEGLFSKSTWQRIFESVGYRPEIAQRIDEGNVDEVFLCKKP